MPRLSQFINIWNIRHFYPPFYHNRCYEPIPTFPILLKRYDNSYKCIVAEMEIVPEGKNFRLVTEEELPAVADILVQYMPESLKVILSVIVSETL